MIVQDEISLTKVKNGVDGGDGKDGTDGKDGENGKDSNTYTAYSWSPDGSDRFTTAYPNENLVLRQNFLTTYAPYNSVPKVDELGKLETVVINANMYGIITIGVPKNTLMDGAYTVSGVFKINGKPLKLEQMQYGLRANTYNSKGAGELKGDGSFWIREWYANLNWILHFAITDLKKGDVVTIDKFKFELTTPQIHSTIYTPSPKDDFNNAWPTFIGTYSSHNKVQSQNPKDYTWARIRGADGSDGKDGQTPKDVISGYLSNEAIIVPATPTGNVTDYSKALGDFVVFEGQIKLVNGVTYSKVSEVNMTSTINSAGRYVVTALSADTGTATYRATYAGVTVDKILIVVKNKQGPSGSTGPQGPPTGITTLPTIPTDPYIGMLWQNTGSNNGYLTGIVYQWNGAKWNTFIFSAENIVANSLSALSTKTGSLDVTGDITLQTDNTVIKGSYDYGDNFGQAYYDRWFDGIFEVGRRFLKYLGNVYQVNPNNTKGDYICYAESYYGLDYFKMREYVSESNRTLLGRVDIHGQAIQLSNSWGAATVGIQSNGLIYTKILSVDRIASHDNRAIQIGGEISALSEISVAESNIYFNQDRPELADFRIGKDGSNLAGGRVIKSESMYDRTYSSAANVVITSDGVLGRSTSARKYKTDIKIAEEVIKNAKRVLNINPSSWIDKGDLSDGIENKRYHGFIADEFDEAGLKEVVVYGANGQIESLAYDRIPIYHNVILKEQEKEIADLNRRIKRLENQLELIMSKL